MQFNRGLKPHGRAVLTLCILLAPASNVLAEGGPREVTADASKTIGTIRSLQGVHFDPGPAGGQLSKNYIGIGVSSIRIHDAQRGSGIADIDGFGSEGRSGPIFKVGIFPNFDADPKAIPSR